MGELFFSFKLDLIKFVIFNCRLFTRDLQPIISFFFQNSIRVCLFRSLNNMTSCIIILQEKTNKEKPVSVDMSFKLNII